MMINTTITSDSWFFHIYRIVYKYNGNNKWAVQFDTLKSIRYIINSYGEYTAQNSHNASILSPNISLVHEYRSAATSYIDAKLS